MRGDPLRCIGVVETTRLTNASVGFECAHGVDQRREVAKQSICEVVDPSMHFDIAGGGRLQDRRFAHMHDLDEDVEFAESARLPRCCWLTVDFCAVELCDVPNMANPVIKDAASTRRERGGDTSASVVTANDDVLNLEFVYREVDHRKTIEIAVHNQVGNIAMHEDFTWHESDDFVGGNPTIGAADPEVLRVLLSREILEESRMIVLDTRGPLSIIRKKLREIRHAGDLSRESIRRFRVGRNAASRFRRAPSRN